MSSSHVIIDFKSIEELGVVQSSINRGVIRQEIGLGGGEGKSFSLTASPLLLTCMALQALQAKQSSSVTPFPQEMPVVQAVNDKVMKQIFHSGHICKGQRGICNFSWWEYELPLVLFFFFCSLP